MKNIHFDKERMTRSMRELQSDVDTGELTATAWLWIIGGSLLGFLASCVRFSKKGTKPILARFDRIKKGMEG